MVMTKRGIFHNLNESEYAISNDEVALFFSSMFYLGKYLEEYKDNRKMFRKRIERAMILDDLNTDLLADITLYKEIEKRGFYVTVLDDYERWIELEWQELRLFALQKMTEKNTLDWYEIHVEN